MWRIKDTLWKRNVRVSDLSHIKSIKNFLEIVMIVKDNKLDEKKHKICVECNETKLIIVRGMCK
jgi:hypothetical protein